MKTYEYGVLEELPEDTRTLAEKQRDTLLEALQAILYYTSKIPAFGDSIGKEITKAEISVVLKKARSAIAAIESGKVPI